MDLLLQGLFFVVGVASFGLYVLYGFQALVSFYCSNTKLEKRLFVQVFCLAILMALAMVSLYVYSYLVGGYHFSWLLLFLVVLPYIVLLWLRFEASPSPSNLDERRLSRIGGNLNGV